MAGPGSKARRALARHHRPYQGRQCDRCNAGRSGFVWCPNLGAYMIDARIEYYLARAVEADRSAAIAKTQGERLTFEDLAAVYRDRVAELRAAFATARLPCSCSSA